MNPIRKKIQFAKRTLDLNPGYLRKTCDKIFDEDAPEMSSSESDELKSRAPNTEDPEYQDKAGLIFEKEVDAELQLSSLKRKLPPLDVSVPLDEPVSSDDEGEKTSDSMYKSPLRSRETSPGKKSPSPSKSSKSPSPTKSAGSPNITIEADKDLEETLEPLIDVQEKSQDKVPDESLLETPVTPLILTPVDEQSPEAPPDPVAQEKVEEVGKTQAVPTTSAAADDLGDGRPGFVVGERAKKNGRNMLFEFDLTGFPHDMKPRITQIIQNGFERGSHKGVRLEVKFDGLAPEGPAVKKKATLPKGGGSKSKAKGDGQKPGVSGKTGLPTVTLPPLGAPRPQKMILPPLETPTDPEKTAPIETLKEPKVSKGRTQPSPRCVEVKPAEVREEEKTDSERSEEGAASVDEDVLSLSTVVKKFTEGITLPPKKKRGYAARRVRIGEAGLTLETVKAQYEAWDKKDPNVLLKLCLNTLEAGPVLLKMMICVFPMD